MRLLAGLRLEAFAAALLGAAAEPPWWTAEFGRTSTPLGHDENGHTVFTLPAAPARTAHSYRQSPSSAVVEPRKVLAVVPAGAPASGNLTVLVLGQRFDDFGDVKCRCGAVDVPAV